MYSTDIPAHVEIPVMFCIWRDCSVVGPLGSDWNALEALSRHDEVKRRKSVSDKAIDRFCFMMLVCFQCCFCYLTH